MDQKAFNSIQNNFKKFLENKIHPVVKPLKPYVSPPRSSRTVERMERTFGFGKDDTEIGYKISFIDDAGNRRTKIVPVKPT